MQLGFFSYPAHIATVNSSYAPVTCPHCGSIDTSWRSKAGQWECNACEERFPGLAPKNGLQRLGDKAPRPKTIFFSYGHDSNRELVECFRVGLETRGHTVWIDWKEIGNWDDWKGSITRGIDASELTIAFITRHAMRDPGVCRNEIAIAMNRFGVVHLVVLEAGAEGAIPVIATDRQWADLSTWRDIRDGRVPGVEWKRWYEEKLINLIQHLEGDASQFADETATLRRTLLPASFESRVTQHLPGFIGREWVFDAYRAWLQRPESRVFWLKAGPGVGKSALAANLVARERSAIVASWFCDAKSNEMGNSGHALRSLAFQLALRWEDYRVRLLRELSLGPNAGEEACLEARRMLDGKNAQELFDTLLANPLHGLIWRENKLVIVVDALDEATASDGRNPIAELIGMELERLPSWLSFVVTSRPEADVAARLQGFPPFEIDARCAENLADLRAWFDTNMASRPALASLAAERRDAIRELLLERSEGMVLYLKMVDEGLREGSLTVDVIGQLESGLPGLQRRYYDSFAQRFGKEYEDSVKPLLRLLVAAAGPLPEDLACAALNWNREQFLAARNRLGSYVSVTLIGLEAFHKTLTEWLTSPASADFFIDPALARQRIADVLFAELDGKEAHTVRWREAIQVWLPQWLPNIDQRSDAAALNQLACTMHDLGDFAAAESLFREALEIRRATLTTGHPNIATSLNNLARLLTNIGHTSEAELLSREALDTLRSAQPAGHLDIAASLDNLASLLASTGRYAEAESLLCEALDILRSTQPSGHLDFAASLNSLAVVLGRTGRNVEAEELYRETIAMRRAALPTGHPEIASSLNNLAVFLYSTDRSVEAEALFREALDIYRAALPARHLKIGQSLGNLATLLREVGRSAEAEPLYREVLDINRASLPAGHGYIFNSLHCLARLLIDTSRTVEAEQLYREALEDERATLPAGHPAIYRTLKSLAGLLKSTGRPIEAETLYCEALEMRGVALPAGHLDITQTLNELDGLRRRSGHMSRIFSISDLQSEALRHRIAGALAGESEATHAYRTAEATARMILADAKSLAVNFPYGNYIMRLNVGWHRFFARVTVYPNSLTNKVMARMSVEGMATNGSNRHDISTISIDQQILDTAVVIDSDVRGEFSEFVEKFPYFKSFCPDFDEIAMLRAMVAVERTALDPSNELGARAIIKQVMDKRLQIREIYRTKRGPGEASPFID